MPESKKWIVTTSGDRPIYEVAKELTKTGFTVGNVLDEIGSITGDASEDVAQRLRSLPGVVDVSPDSPIDIGPPDTPVTW